MFKINRNLFFSFSKKFNKLLFLSYFSNSLMLLYFNLIGVGKISSLIEIFLLILLLLMLILILFELL